jgi:hypothetical protein
VFLAVLEFTLPGYAWVLASDLHKQISTFEKAVISFVLSLCFSSLLTAVLTFLTADYLYSSVAISLVGALLVIGGYLAKSHVTPPNKLRFSLSTGSKALDLCILAYAFFILGFFWSAPYYPTAQALDLLGHTRTTDAIIAGEGKSTLLHANYPIGFHFEAALLSRLTDISALQSLRVLASLALLAVIPLAYLSAREILGNTKAAGIAVLVAAFVLPADSIHLLQGGTFPNILEDAIVLTVVWLAFRYIRQPSLSVGITLALLGVGGTFVHSGFLIFLAVFWITALLVLAFYRHQARAYVQAAVYSTIGVTAFGVFASFSFQANLQRVLTAYFVVGRPFVFRTAFAEFVRDLLLFLGPVNVVAVVCATLFAIKYRKPVGLIFSLVWLTIMIPGAFLSGEEWRFVLFAMLPGSFLVGNMLTEAPRHLSGVTSVSLVRLKRIAVALVLLLMVVSGMLPNLITQAYNPTGRAQQIAIYQSMIWLKQSNCTGGVASVGLWPDYQYLPAFTDIPYAGDFVRPPDYLLQKSVTLGFSCLVVNKQNQYFQLYEENLSLHEEFSNELVAIFQIS